MELHTLSRVLVFFHKGETEDNPVSLKVPGLVSSQVLHNGEVRELNFTSTEAEFTRNLETCLERQGLAQSCSVSSPLNLLNSACVLSIEGMTCNSCVKLIESTISQVEGVASIKVSLQFKKAFVEYNPGVAKPAALAESIYDMGFDAEVLTTHEATRSSPKALSPTASVERKAAPLATLPSCIVDIEGMTCSSCVQNIQSNVSKARGVVSIKVSLEDKNAWIAFDRSITTPTELAVAIEELGFEAEVRKNELGSGSGTGSGAVLIGSGAALTGSVGNLKVGHVGIDGMTCQSCVNLIESVVGDMEGVVSVNVSLACKEGTVEFNDAVTSADAISKAVDDMGFVVSYVTGTQLWDIDGIREQFM